MKYKQLILLVLLATSLERCYSAFVDYGITVGDTGLGGGDDNTYLVTTTENIKIWKTDQTLFYVSLLQRFSLIRYVFDINNID